MNIQAATRHHMFGKAHSFCLDHFGDFNDIGNFIPYTDALGVLIDALTAATVGQLGADPGIVDLARQEFRLELRNVARTARALGRSLQPPLALHKFRLGWKRSRTGLLTVAESILDELKRPGVEALFAGHGLPNELVKHIEQQRDAYLAFQLAHDNQNNGAIESTGQIRRLSKEGMRLVKLLDAIIRNRYARQPQMLHAWKSASHIQRTVTLRSVAEPAAPTSPGPVFPAQAA